MTSHLPPAAHNDSGLIERTRGRSSSHILPFRSGTSFGVWTYRLTLGRKRRFTSSSGASHSLPFQTAIRLVRDW